MKPIKQTVNELLRVVLPETRKLWSELTEGSFKLPRRDVILLHAPEIPYKAGISARQVTIRS